MNFKTHTDTLSVTCQVNNQYHLYYPHKLNFHKHGNILFCDLSEKI